MDDKFEGPYIKKHNEWLTLSEAQITQACLLGSSPHYKGLIGFIESPEDSTKTIMLVRSFHTGNVYERVVNLDYESFKARMMEVRSGIYDSAYIQDVWPELLAGDRESMMTGLSDDEWNTLFYDEDGETQKKYHCLKNGIEYDS